MYNKRYITHIFPANCYKRDTLSTQYGACSKIPKKSLSKEEKCVPFFPFYFSPFFRCSLFSFCYSLFFILLYCFFCRPKCGYTIAYLLYIAKECSPGATTYIYLFSNKRKIVKPKKKGHAIMLIAVWSYDHLINTHIQSLRFYYLSVLVSHEIPFAYT